MDSAGKRVTVAQLQSLNTNYDGVLSVSEASSLRLLTDLNENGHLDAGELNVVTGAITAVNWSRLTRGNAVLAGYEVAAPTMTSSSQPSQLDKTQLVPASNYRTLRDTDNWYPLPYPYSSIDWTSSMVKINNGTRNTLIGTDGNDAFDASYYSAYSSLFPTPLVNFLGGDGDDQVGGSTGNDSIWGGTGNDTLCGYAGNDKLYGEEGNDVLLGQDGGDYLDGGIGDDQLFGYVGNDVLNGGDGNDMLMGFTPLNDAKQTLNAGETDDDYLYGGAGADTLNGGVGNDYLDGGTENDLLKGGFGDDKLFGGDGIDELQGNDGNDQLVGGAGDDKLFGQVGNDTLWGGEGNDILVGFTPSNDAKQTLNAGETDDDYLYGEGGNDNLYGVAGNDQLDGGIGDDLLVGGEGNDTLFGGDGSDELLGNEGNDQLVSGAGDDKLFGQVGNDTLWGGEGNDILVGFTPSNDAKQTLNAGETDDDALYGGAGSDILIGGLGNDMLSGGDGRDELQGNEGNDQLYGDAGDDNLFGEVGDDTLYGGVGNDLLMGFTASNENKQTLNAGETDNDYLYGGAGYDTLIGGVGDDYLDGGACADVMVGGTGNDIYIVNSVNDTIYEAAGEGYDTVIASTSYLLNANIEELRLLDGAVINGTGNAQDNLIVGNSSDNILDGVTGADTIIGGQGNDIYYVDNAGDVVTEQAGEGSDTVQSSISYQLGSNIENLVLLDFANPERGLVDGQPVLVYGYPKRNELDYMQGDAVQNYQGTCALTSIANLITQTGKPTSESQVVNLAINNGWTVSALGTPSWQLGGSNVDQQRAILDSYGISNDVVAGYNESGIANLVRSGRGVIIAVNAGQLWGDAAYVGNGGVNHAITLTGAVYCKSDGALMGFYITDSGRGLVSDMTRFVDIATFRKVADVADGYAIYTIAPIKFWQEDINGTGNELNNTLVGNRGDNVLTGLAGNDTLDGGMGVDSLVGGIGDDTYFVDNSGDVVTEQSGAGIDSVFSSISYTLGVNVENLTLNGSDNLSGTGNGLDNSLTGNIGNNTLDGGVGNDMLDGGYGADVMRGGIGNDIYVVDNTGDVVLENAGEGVDSVNASVSYCLTSNVENLTLIGGSSINGTGNSLANKMVGNYGNNMLTGLEGNDTLEGGFGLDMMVGGIGNDYLNGNSDNDQYLFNRGDGTDTINDEYLVISGYSTYVVWVSTGKSGYYETRWDPIYQQQFGGYDTLKFGAGITLEDLDFEKSGSDVVIGLRQSGAALPVSQLSDKVTLKNWDNVNTRIEYIAFDNWNSYCISDLFRIGTVGDDTLTGQMSMPQFMYGGAGNDSLNGGYASDTLDGGIGNDTLSGGNGADYYRFARGGGQDTIIDKDSPYSPDTLKFGAGITLEDLDFEKSGSDIIVGLRQTGAAVAASKLTDRVTLQNWSNLSTRIEFIEFADGARFYIENWFRIGGASDETLTGRDGCSQFMYGGAGNDLLTGGNGFDMIDGGIGNDTLRGGLGRDYYRFARGGGQDMIIDRVDTSGSYDFLAFASDIASDQLWFKHAGNDLLISIIGASDSVTVCNWYSGSVNHINIGAGNGKVLTESKVEQLVQAMASLSAPVAGQTVLTLAQQTQLAPVLAASWN